MSKRDQDKPQRKPAATRVTSSGANVAPKPAGSMSYQQGFSSAA